MVTQDYCVLEATMGNPSNSVLLVLEETTFSSFRQDLCNGNKVFDRPSLLI